MNRKLLGLGMAAAMLVAASSAMAAGINMSWSNCFGEGTGTQNRTFACTANTGTNILVTSFVLPVDMPQTSGNELVIDVLTTSNPIPPWWQFRDVGTCRQTSLSSNTSQNPNDVVCVDWASGQSQGGIGAYSAELGTIDGSLLNQHRRIKIAIAIALPLVDLVADQEYFSTNITINNAKSTGLGACAGCGEPVCLVFNSILITRNVGVGDLKLSDPTTPGSNIVTWQGTGPNCQLVPTRNVTWGSVKSLYR
jgi:hypothetical protein